MLRNRLASTGAKLRAFSAPLPTTGKHNARSYSQVYRSFFDSRPHQAQVKVSGHLDCNLSIAATLRGDTDPYR